jgi:zinc protease
LQKIQREDLYQHYQSFYTPCNALIAIAGDFNTQDMLDRLNGLYANHPNGQPPRRNVPPVELMPLQENRLEVEGPGETTFIQLSYRAPAASDPDFFAFSVLDSLLSGPTSLNMFGGGGISNKTSRLYRSLVEKERAVSVHGGLQATIDPFLYDVHITVHPQSTPETVLSAFDDEIKRLQDTLVSEAEIKRAIKQARALFAYGSENITNQAFWLGYAEMFASYDWFTGYLAALDQIRPEDVQRIAQTYLRSSNRVIGTYLPTGEEVEENESDETC